MHASSTEESVGDNFYGKHTARASSVQGHAGLEKKATQYILGSKGVDSDAPHPSTLGAYFGFVS